MESERNKFNSRIFIGLLLILVGGLYLLNTLTIINVDISDIIFSLPFFVFIVGLIVLMHSTNKTLGLLLVFLGGLFLVPRIFPAVHYSSDILFPVLIITFGVYILLKRPLNWAFYKDKLKRNATRDTLDEITIFGGGHKAIVSENFKGGNLTAIFGGFEIDLSHSRLAPGDNIIDVFFLFGGVTFLVPRDWDIRVSVAPIFGGFSNKVRREPGTAVDTSRTLIIKGITIFGGGEIKPVYV